MSVPSSPTGSSQHVSLQAPAQYLLKLDILVPKVGYFSTGSSQHVSLQAPAGVCCMLGYSIEGTRCRAGHCIRIGQVTVYVC